VLGKSDLLIMAQQWYQTEHGLRRLGGNTSRNPEFKFQYFTDAPLLGDLIALFNADQPHLAPVIDAQLDAMIARNRPLAAQVLNFLGVEFVTVHVEKSPAQLLRFIDAVLPLALLTEERTAAADGSIQTIRLYKVAQPVPTLPLPPVAMDDPLANLFLAEGWSPPAGAPVRYATRSQPLLLLNLLPGGSRVLLTWAAPQNALGATVNGTAVATTLLAADGTRWALDVPAGLADRPAVAPGAAGVPPGPEGWPVGKTGAYLPPNSSLLVRSAGQETGDFAHIWLDGVDVARGERGYNLAAIDAGGRLLGQATFDTLAAPEASAAMAAWLQSWPQGTVIAGAVADEASLQLGENAVDALATLGVATDLRGKFRWSHAFVGAAGAPAGTAVEDAALLRPAVVNVGLPVDAPRIWGELQELAIEQAE
jgi:hypothetical protein